MSEIIYVVMVDDWGSLFSKPTTPHGAYHTKEIAEEAVKDWPKSSYDIHEMILH